MDVKILSVFFAAVLAHAVAFPAPGSAGPASETELIDPKYGNQPVVDTGVISGGGFFDNSFDLFQSMESMMKRMRDQMNSFLNRYGGSAVNGTDIGDFSGLGFPNLPDLDLGKGNTTSVTKVINGHKVVINETKYGREDPNGGAFFKVRVIEVKPDPEDAGNNQQTPQKPRDVEPLENSQENEIPKKVGTEARYGTLEPLDDIDYMLHRKTTPIFNRFGNIEDMEADNRIDGPLAQPIKPYDLSRDIYVNKLLADRGHPINPDAEFLGSKLRSFNGGHDLSGDIWVNQLMADQGRRPNPDAEFIRNTKKFEKLIDPR